MGSLLAPPTQINSHVVFCTYNVEAKVLRLFFHQAQKNLMQTDTLEVARGQPSSQQWCAHHVDCCLLFIALALLQSQASRKYCVMFIMMASNNAVLFVNDLANCIL